VILLQKNDIQPFIEFQNRDAMKTSLLIKIALLAVIFFPGCNKDDSDPVNITITEGYYEGFFAASNDTIWEAISFKANLFFEQPSGGLQLGSQKFPCIVEGSYQITDKEISFDVFEYPDIDLQCDSNIILSGTYAFQSANDIIVFQKGAGNNKQTYKLELKSSSR
jgi:hypothetical protein